MLKGKLKSAEEKFKEFVSLLRMVSSYQCFSPNNFVSANRLLIGSNTNLFRQAKIARRCKSIREFPSGKEFAEKQESNIWPWVHRQSLQLW